MSDSRPPAASDSGLETEASRPEATEDGRLEISRSSARDLSAPRPSVLDLVAERTGTAPRVTLHEEAAPALAEPVIDPSSAERTAVPEGRGSYQVMGEIARGGMGVVLRGHDVDLGRDVAMKVLSRDLADRPEVVQRFVEEAQIGGQLQHPGIVPVYELGLLADERPYFTMKLVKGRTLASLIAARSSPEDDRRRLLGVFESICQTIAYAHSRGVIHRDLKPANVMVGAFGEVQVVDWGLAKVLARGGTADEKRARKARETMAPRTILETVRSGEGSGSGSESIVGSVMGTPAYMPPEQASGLVDRLDERSDVFSLGAILCELLTGAPPYPGDRSEAIAAAAMAECEEALARLDASGVDPDLIKLTKSCLCAAPAARPQDAGAVAERIHQHLTGLEESAHQARVEAAASRVRAEEERKARKLTLALAASVLFGLVLGGGGWLWMREQRLELDRFETARLAAEAEEERARERAEEKRLRGLAEEVNGVLAEAAGRAGAGDWTGALASIERARSMATSGAGGDELSGTVARQEEEIRRASAAAAEEVRLRASNEALLVELRGLRGVSEDNVDHAERYEAAFARYGLELDKRDPEAGAETLLLRGLGPEVAIALDAWARVHLELGEEERSLHLLQIAQIVDSDPMRANLREAAHAEDREVLSWIAENGMEDQPPATFEVLARSVLALGDRTGALEVLRRGARLYPDDISLAACLAGLLTPPAQTTGPLEELQEAIGYHQRVLALAPEDHEAWHQFAHLLGKLQRHGESIECFERALELDQGNGELLTRLGNSCRLDGQPGRAIQYCLRAREAEGRGWWKTWVVLFHAEALADLGRDEEALEVFDEAIDALLPEGSAYTSYAEFLIMRPRFHGRIRPLLDRARQWVSGVSRIENNVAWTLITTVERTEASIELARELAESSVEADPSAGSSWNTLGAARYFAGDYEGAREAITRSIELAGDGGHEVDWLVLAMCHARRGEEGAARVWYERAEGSYRGREVPEEEKVFLVEAKRLLGL